MTDERLVPARDLEEGQRVALERLLAVITPAQAGGEWSVERIVGALRAAHAAGLSPDEIAVEAGMSINAVRGFLDLPRGRREAYDWRIRLSDQAGPPVAGEQPPACTERGSVPSP
ncbi:hypothetical protein [Georgenia thermotolerans]|uniref:hypothetical protein n=1 Tax=Georgenia thermotolerans TaxID=527326 RepID=UPI0014789E07|nr:hypothetical protein [Georgenia thermotolerans]